ncbi:hypothetical protein OUZ56_011702 [Daphnia magna]|uniref:Uncharacterized protein n=1 Tax=Daphnia magna TaxID=35525 RepID=A0ABQ9Z0X1_9CRUS|nr:hypothetical protein OUZ56_011702 [Daphnia magna]
MRVKTDQLVHVNRIKPLYESMIWKEEPCVDFQESRDHPIPLELTNELEVPPPTDEEYALQEEQDLIDLDAGPSSLPEGAITSNLHKGPNIDLSFIPERLPLTALEPVAQPVPPVAPRPECRTGLRPWSALRPPNGRDTSHMNSSSCIIVDFPPRLLFFTTLAAFNATVCNYDGAANLGFLEFNEEDCSFEAAPTPPVPITYAIYSTLREVKRFAGHTCGMWVATTTVYKDFMQWNQVSYGRNPIEVDAATCRRMRDSRQCRGKAMDITGPNSFALDGHPFVETSWLRTATEKMTNCRLEEVTLQSECPNCAISSPLGDIPGAMLFQIQPRDPSLGRFLEGSEAVSVCGGGNLTAYFPVLGMDRVVIAVREAAKGTDLVEMRPNNADAMTKMALSELTRAEIEYASHTQYIRDFAMDISNHLAREIRNLQFESRKTAYHAATTTAQYDGWLAAKHLDLPLCTKLLVVGASVSVLQCFPSNVTFETVFMPCGAQPRWGNQTIHVKGWELTKFSDCYWHAYFVNFNGKAHAFKNNTWMPINPNLELQGHRFIDTMPLEVDNSLGIILQLHPTITSHPLSASTIMADILAYKQMGYVTEISGERHVNTVLVHPGQAQDVSFMARIGYWLRNFGISWFSLSQSAHRDLELGPQATTSLALTAPVTIVNIPPPPTPAGSTGRLGLNQQPYLIPPTSCLRSLAQHRKAAALLLRP